MTEFSFSFLFHHQFFVIHSWVLYCCQCFFSLLNLCKHEINAILAVICVMCWLISAQTSQALRELIHHDTSRTTLWVIMLYDSNSLWFKYYVSMGGRPHSIIIYDYCIRILTFNIEYYDNNSQSTADIWTHMKQCISK